MLKLTGALLVLCGCMGYGFCIYYRMKESVRELEQLIYIFQMFESEISYRRETLPEACYAVGERINGKYAIFLKEVAQKNRQDRDFSFNEHWKREGVRYLKKSNLSREDLEFLISFPKYTGFSDEQMQIKVIKEYVDRLQKRKKEVESDLKEKQRIIFGLSAVSGLVLVIFLL